ncbi:MAG: rod shape-determining protein MreD [Gammaproteobacteria bacterium GWE2_42_36]|nr:MAG: rod shape-determining protein MreD [Gammaproteobacteria bacterium GWE2_42_36]HCU05857.1 rod shape-determining protein MreD [Coxiellaceae bacterium]
MFTQETARARWVIGITFLVAFSLMILPLPSEIERVMPDWLLLVLIYWAMALPAVVSIFTAFFIGMIADLLMGTLWGEQAFALVLVTYLVVKLHQRIRVYPLTQQMIIIFLFVLLYKLIILIIQDFLGLLPHSFSLYWISLLTSTLIWPWIFILLRDVRRRFHIS